MVTVTAEGAFSDPSCFFKIGKMNSSQAKSHDNSEITSRGETAAADGAGVDKQPQQSSEKNSASSGDEPVPFTEFMKNRPANVDHSELEKLPNPFRFPLILLNCGLEFNGVPCVMAPVTDDPVTRAKKLRALPMREDDILLLAYPKCGTHWLSHMIDMLLRGSVEIKDTTKAGAMIEFRNNLDALKDDPSPRFFTSHLTFAHLPEEIVEKKVKIVHIYRNMKDQTVSFYHHAKQYFKPDSEVLSFDNYFKGYLTDGYFSFGHQWDYLKQMWEFERANPSHPIKHVSYEALQKDPLPVLVGVCQFLGLAASEDFCREVIEACSIENVRKADKRFTRSLSLFRKGVVGDWKNLFTVAQSEQFDEHIREKERTSDGFSLKYFEGFTDVDI